MKNIFYVTSYNSPFSQRSYIAAPSSITYSNYIIDSLCSFEECHINVLSLSLSKEKVYFTKKITSTNNKSEVYFRSFPQEWGRIFTRLSQVWIYMQVFTYILFNYRKGDTILIFHDYGLSFLYKVFRTFIRCDFIYLVCEIFNAVYDKGKNAIEKECKRLSNGDAYIFVNTELPKIFNVGKPYCICSGNYNYVAREKVNDGKVHVIYAGKISTGIINDAFFSLEVAKLLPGNHCIHFAGYGEDEDIEKLKKEIKDLNILRGYEYACYEGNLSGDSYESLLSKCHIGLCTRTLKNELSNYCFPSKTLVYLTHNIIPICPKIDILGNSAVKDLICFVENLTPEALALSVMKAENRIIEYDNGEFLNKLSKDFRDNLKNILFKNTLSDVKL